MKPDYRPQIIAFNLSDAMEGKINPELEPFDTVRVFGVYDFQDPPTVTVNGEVRNPGQHQINGVMHLRDAIFLAGGLTPNALLEDAQVVRRAEQGWVRVLNVNLQQALEGSEADNILLENLDQIYVQTAVALISPPEVNINGEVSKPGPYTLGRGMKVSDLIGLAGGLLRGAVREYADLTRYSYENGKKVESQVVQVELGRILAGDKSADIELQDGDVLAIRQISGWRDIGASVVVAGEVNHPGTFGIRPGERLSSVLMRAGGFRSTAYPYGAVLERVEVQRLAEKTKEDLITRIEDQQFAGIQFGSTSNSASDSADLEKAFLLEQQQVATHLRETPVIGRLVIRIPDQLKRWINSQDDIELRDGDILTIPKKPNFVLVSGEVYGPNAISIRRGRNAEWYLRQAGGTTELAKKSDIYVIRADGEVIGKGGGGWWGGKVKNLVLQPGDSIVVPEKIMIGNSVWQRLVESASVLGNLAVAGRVATSF
jgi:protein involved in polysaccharide export with SLBB domain